MQEIWLVYIIYQYDGYDDTEVYSLKEKACRAADREVRKFKKEGYKIADGYDDVSFDILSADGFGYLRLENKDGEVEIVVEKKFLR